MLEQLKLKVSAIYAVRDHVLGHPLSYIIAALSSDFGHFSHLSKVHLNPLPLVVGRGNIRSMVVKPSLARCISRVIASLTKAVK